MSIKYQIYAGGHPSANTINAAIAALIPTNALYVSDGSGAARVHEAREHNGNVELRTANGWRWLGESALWDAEEQ